MGNKDEFFRYVQGEVQGYLEVQQPEAQRTLEINHMSAERARHLRIRVRWCFGAELAVR